MNKDDAKKISVSVQRPRTKLVLFDDTGHKVLAYATIRFKVDCQSIVIIDELYWAVVGWGPTDDTDCRAICRIMR